MPDVELIRNKLEKMDALNAALALGAQPLKTNTLKCC